MTVEELREKSAKFGFKMANKETGNFLASGYYVVAAADKQMGKATKIPKEIAEKLKHFAKQVL